MATTNHEECFHESIVDEIISIICNVIAIILMLTIGIVTRKRLSSDAKMHLQLEILFFIGIAAGCIVQIGSILSIALCPSQGIRTQLSMFLFVVYYGFVLLFSCVIATLVVRLYLCFADSMWKMSRTKLIISISLTLIMCLVWIISAVLYWFEMISNIMFYGLSASGLLLFIINCVISVYYFIRNLLSVAGLKDSVRDTTVNAKQQRLINVSAKYLTLFLVAVCSSMVCMSMTAVFRIIIDIHPGIIWAMDCVLNVLCLYLQVQCT